MVKKMKELISAEKLNARIEEMAKKIESDYLKEEIVLVCILKGAVYFAIDLSRKIKNNNIILDFIKVSSYGNEKETSGKVNFCLDLSIDIKNKNVIIVEDIIDSGYTLNYLYDYIIGKQPKSIKICVLLDKKERRQKDIKVDYIGFEIENKFVVGYGLDYQDTYRNLPYIGYIE